MHSFPASLPNLSDYNPRSSHKEPSPMRIGVLRGRENSFPEAFIAKVNSLA